MTDSVTLLAGWSDAVQAGSLYLFPGDKAVLDAKPGLTVCYPSWAAYVASGDVWHADDKRLHIGLVPVPFIGHLETASIFVLTLNPRVAPCNYFAETQRPQFEDKAFLDALLCNLAQQNAADTYPFMWLNPQFAWHPGFEYWVGATSKILTQLEAHGMTRSQAALCLARKLAVLQLIPYPSRVFYSRDSELKRLIHTLPSSLAAQEHAQGLMQRALAGKAFVIVMRGDAWRAAVPLGGNSNILVSSNPRSKYINDNAARQVANWIVQQGCGN